MGRKILLGLVLWDQYLLIFNEGGSFHFLREKLGGPYIIQQKYEGRSHKISLHKNEFFPAFSQPLYFVTSS